MYFKKRKNMTTILLTGSTGQIGRDLMSSLQGFGDIIPISHQDMHLEDFNQIRKVVRTVAPDIIIHPAAYTNVNQAECDPEKAMRVNAEATAILAHEAQRLNAGMIYYSTDYVFDGKQSTPYTEEDLPHPINVYGQSKYAGEIAVMQHCEAHWIIRTSWVYSILGNNFLKAIIRQAQEKETLTVINDQFGSPTWSATMSDITRKMLQHAHASPSVASHIKHTAGIYHATAAGSTSWYEYAQYILAQLKQHNVPLAMTNIDEAIIPVSSAVLTEQAERPKNSCLATHKLHETFGIQLPHWQIDVASCIDEMINEYQLQQGHVLP